MAVTDMFKPCARCGQKIRIKHHLQKYCPACALAVKREVTRECYRRGRERKNNYPAVREELVRQQTLMEGLTLEFRGGQWYWSKGRLSNGPFGSLKGAKGDFLKAVR